MDNDLDTLQAAVAWRRAGEQVALATVIQTWGSSPRPVGSHMAIRSDGRFVGSVSAGCVENAVVTGAVGAIDGDTVQTLGFGVSAWRNGLSCGGKIEVLVQPLVTARPLERVIASLDADRPCALALDRATPGMEFLHTPDEAPEDCFVRRYRPLSKLVIAGAVHIAEPLAVMAGLAGFDVTVIDPRREFALRGRFDRAPQVAWPDAYFQDHPISADTAVISLTHTPKVDHPTMVAALNSSAFYVGALGSAATHAKRLQRLAHEGFGPEQLARIHGPIGLPINASSPAEIAVAILAEMISVRKGGR
jgi:xanthine dehydrogenase accessory factor